MVARQNHGFIYEAHLAKEHSLKLIENYTDKFDAHTPDGVPVNIKTAKFLKNVEMGSFNRQAEQKEDFYLAIGWWEGNTSNIIQENILYISGDYWAEQFDTVLASETMKIVQNITNLHADDAEWKKRRIQATREWNKLGTIIQLHPKRDHKKQLRIQCSIRKKSIIELMKTNSVSDFTAHI